MSSLAVRIRDRLKRLQVLYVIHRQFMLLSSVSHITVIPRIRFQRRVNCLGPCNVSDCRKNSAMADDEDFFLVVPKFVLVQDRFGFVAQCKHNTPYAIVYASGIDRIRLGRTVFAALMKYKTAMCDVAGCQSRGTRHSRTNALRAHIRPIREDINRRTDRRFHLFVPRNARPPVTRAERQKRSTTKNRTYATTHRTT